MDEWPGGLEVVYWERGEPPAIGCEPIGGSVGVEAHAPAEPLLDAMVPTTEAQEVLGGSGTRGPRAHIERGVKGRGRVG